MSQGHSSARPEGVERSHQVEITDGQIYLFNFCLFYIYLKMSKVLVVQIDVRNKAMKEAGEDVDDEEEGGEMEVDVDPDEAELVERDTVDE